MKVVIRNNTNKKVSVQEKQKLKEFVFHIAQSLNIETYIPVVYLTYKKKWNGYYPKNKPLAGFFKSWNGKRVSIDFVAFWDTSLTARKEAIVHELTHAKQLIEKKLVIYKNGRQMKWNGNYYRDWKKWKTKEVFTIKNKSQRIASHTRYLPWEKDVVENVKTFLNKQIII
jgi:hypothetical protein